MLYGVGEASPRTDGVAEEARVVVVWSSWEDCDLGACTASLRVRGIVDHADEADDEEVGCFG